MSEEPNSSANKKPSAELLQKTEPTESGEPKELREPASLGTNVPDFTLQASLHRLTQTKPGKTMNPKPSETKNHSRTKGEPGTIKSFSLKDAGMKQEPSEEPQLESSTLTVAVFGNSSAVVNKDENLLLRPSSAHPHVPVPIKRLASGRLLFIINMLDLHQGELYLDPMEQFPHHLARENMIQAFILVLQVERLTDDDKLLLEWLQKKFGEASFSSVMILFTYEKDENSDSIIMDRLKNPVLGKLIERCGNRYHVCSRSMNNQSEMSTLLQKLDYLDSGAQYCFTAEMNYGALKVGEHAQEREEVQIGQLQREDDDGTAVGTEEENRTEPEPALQQNEEPVDGRTQDEVQDRKDIMTKLLSKFQLHDDGQLKTSDFLNITDLPLKFLQPCEEQDLVSTFLRKLLLLDYRARYIPQEQPIRESSPPHRATSPPEDLFSSLFSASVVDRRATEQVLVHPMDIQMAAYHRADNFLRQLMVTKLSQCQFAVPLIVPHPLTGELHLPLWTLRQVKKSWKTKGIVRCRSMFEVPTPMVAFYRLSSSSSSKSQLINDLINERHHTFFHRNCPQSSRTRFLMDGVVEIAWYCPDNKNSDWPNDCTAFCNLHGDAGIHGTQREVLMELSTVNVMMLSALCKEDENWKIIEDLSNSPKPAIFLLTDSDCAVEEIGQGTYKIGIKDKSHSAVTPELKKTLQKCCTYSKKLKMTQGSAFTVKDISKHARFIVDEDTEECLRAKEAAEQIITLINKEPLSEIKKKHLPCQGTLWHQWSRENKSLHHLMGQPEKHKAFIEQEMRRLRNQQQKSAFSPLMKQFLQSLKDLHGVERVYLLKWIEILLDIHTSDNLSELYHQYDQQWSEVLNLKETNRTNSEQVLEKQAELESTSEKLGAATFGVEHFLREMGQIYESCSSILPKTEHSEFQYLPQIAAEIISSGFPLELMDGDAGHVPLIWVTAVLDELIKKVGDQRVFVLSVLGIQSSGKSTMLNAMFGLQFAVSAGRCTRGVFMQLLSVSEKMREKLGFDYILVVDTEGLRALEMAGKKNIRHDNELATFVIGIGNLTLINIFGESPSEMQDILQIVVQALLRMKKVRLNPSCMFVHQNVGDLTAGERNMKGRRRLLEKLDKMTRLAAKEEDSDAECFRDIIIFDVQNDVRYFAQLWEGSPPMAPPNPSYSRHVHDIKENILEKVSRSRGLSLSEFKLSVGELWKALLNEHFVFSFRNTLEIAAYRRLEHEYSKWTWSLRSAMRTVLNKLNNRANNQSSFRIQKEDLVTEMKPKQMEVDEAVKRFFTEDHDKEILVQWKDRFERKIQDLYSDLVEATMRRLDQLCEQRAARERVNEKKSEYEKKLFILSKELAVSLKVADPDEQTISTSFHQVWSDWVSELTRDAPAVSAIDISRDITKILSETFELSLVCERKRSDLYHKIDVLGNYSDYVIFKKAPESLDEQVKKEDEGVNEPSGVSSYTGSTQSSTDRLSGTLESNQLLSHDHDQLRELVKAVLQQVDEEIQQMPSEQFGYNHCYIQQVIESVKAKVNAHEQTKRPYVLKKDFTLDLCLRLCGHAAQRFAELQEQLREANDVKTYLEKQKPQYLKVFQNYCMGANATKVFGEFIVNKLEPSIVQAAYEQSGLDVAEKMKSDVPAFSGNRANLEKLILTSLVEKEDFQSYIRYLYKPKEHFNNFIMKQVYTYLRENELQVLGTIRGNMEAKGRRAMEAVDGVTAEIRKSAGDVKAWLQSLSKALKDELLFKEESCLDHGDIQDLEFLQSVVINALTTAVSKLKENLQNLDLERFRKKPQEIMIEQLCGCCWAHCPFCHAICTNTLEDHSGDHSVRFHRNCGIMGWSFMYSHELGVEFCTTAVSSNNMYFRSNGELILFKNYKHAGGEYAKWNICRDDSEMPYWKWFLCRFQKDLEEHYNKSFKEGTIPKEWRELTKDKAIESLTDM